MIIIVIIGTDTDAVIATTTTTNMLVVLMHLRSFKRLEGLEGVAFAGPGMTCRFGIC